MTATQPTAGRSRGYQITLVALLSLTFGIVFFDRNALGFLMPFVQPDLGLSNTQIGLLAAILASTWALSGFIVGSISDRTGRRKPILILATLIFAFASLLSGLASSFAMLLGARLLMGVAEGGVLPVSQSILASEIDPERRGVAMGFMQNFGSNFLGTSLAPVLLIPIAAAFGWRAALYIAAVPGILCAILLWRFVDEPRTPEDKGAPTALGPLLRDRNVVVCTLMAIFFISYLITGLVFLPVVLTQMRGLDAGTMGWLIGAMGLAAAVSGFVIPGISDRVGRKPVLLIVPYLGVIVPLATLFFAGSVAALAAALVTGWLVIGAFPVFLATVPSETVAPRQVATTLGLIQGIGEAFGGVVAPALAGAAADAYGLQAPMWIMVGLALAAGITATGLRETAPRALAKRSAMETVHG